MTKLLERAFGAVGRSVVAYPWVSIVVSFIITLGLGSGFFVAIETENRPEELWVPSSAAALEHNDYVSTTWPSSQRFDFWIAECREEGCNVFDAKYQQRLLKIHQSIMDIEVDGSALRATQKSYGDVAKDEWEAMYSGNWTFETQKGTRSKCYKFGPFCGQSGILDVFKVDPAVIGNLTDTSSLAAVNFWETQATLCPVSIATDGSPCVDTSVYNGAAQPNDCQAYDTKAAKANCRKAADAYCNVTCPAICVKVPGVDQCVPRAEPGTKCWDEGCITLLGFESINSTDDNSTGAPDGAFAFEPFSIKTVASSGSNGPAVDTNGKYVSAKAVMGYYVLGQETILISGSDTDPVADAWEEQALCKLGIKTPDSTKECPEDDLFVFKAQFSRSLSDEFGTTISADVPLLGAAICLIVIYLAIMLSRRDSVHASVGLSFVVVFIVGLSYLAGMGLGAFIGLMNNNLNNNIPFLLLGLGVDDAFVLAGEFVRARKLNPKGTPEDWAVSASQYGGVSILITSMTDALAFLVGSLTVLPALGWFCAFAGMGVIFCFLLQITVLLPALVINQKRVDANRLDFFCCFHSKDDEHDFETPNGCCSVFCKGMKTDYLPRFMEKFGNMIVKPVGVIATLLLFGSLLGVGIAGTTKMYKDFKLEWFVPDNSYLNDFYQMNDEYFASGTPASIYIKNIDYFDGQSNLTTMYDYLNTTKYVDRNADITDWFHAFIMNSAADDETRKLLVDGDTAFGNETTFYNELFEWYRLGGGVRYRNSIQWVDPNCNTEAGWDDCRATSGINATRVGFTLAKDFTDQGQQRYDTMTAVRAKVKEMFPPVDGDEMAYPYSFNFLYWEEVGVIDVELWRNLGICGGVILGVIFLMMPNPRVAPVVVITIVSSIVEVIGFLHYWGVTISGVSTIYILICVGLAVDYSAHIGHIFTVSSGTSKERAIQALARIGPSTFNAIVSTLLAVVVLSASQSFVFRVFFKALFLVVMLGGSNGLWLLPVLLSLVGGSKGSQVMDPSGTEMKNVVTTPHGAAELDRTGSASAKKTSYVA